MNNLRIIETPCNDRFITYLKNSTPTHYSSILSFDTLRMQEILDSYKKQSKLSRIWLVTLFTRKRKIPRLETDKVRKLTLNEYFKIEQTIKYANAIYNKKTDKLILKKMKHASN